MINVDGYWEKSPDSAFGDVDRLPGLDYRRVPQAVGGLQFNDRNVMDQADSVQVIILSDCIVLPALWWWAGVC